MGARAAIRVGTARALQGPVQPGALLAVTEVARPGRHEPRAGPGRRAACRWPSPTRWRGVDVAARGPIVSHDVLYAPDADAHSAAWRAAAWSPPTWRPPRWPRSPHATESPSARSCPRRPPPGRGRADARRRARPGARPPPRCSGDSRTRGRQEPEWSADSTFGTILFIGVQPPPSPRSQRHPWRAATGARRPFIPIPGRRAPKYDPSSTPTRTARLLTSAGPLPLKTASRTSSPPRAAWAASRAASCAAPRPRRSASPATPRSRPGAPRCSPVGGPDPREALVELVDAVLDALQPLRQRPHAPGQALQVGRGRQVQRAHRGLLGLHGLLARVERAGQRLVDQRGLQQLLRELPERSSPCFWSRSRRPSPSVLSVCSLIASRVSDWMRGRGPATYPCLAAGPNPQAQPELYGVSSLPVSRNFSPSGGRPSSSPRAVQPMSRSTARTARLGYKPAVGCGLHIQKHASSVLHPRSVPLGRVTPHPRRGRA